MRRRSRRKSIRLSTLAMGLLAIVCAASVVRLLYIVGAGAFLDGAVRSLAENEVVTGAVLEAELGHSYSIQQLASEAVLSQSSLLQAAEARPVKAADNIDTQSDAQPEAELAETYEPVKSLALSESLGESPLPDMPYYGSYEQDDYLHDSSAPDDAAAGDETANEPVDVAQEAFNTEDTRGVFTQADADGIKFRNDTSYTPQVYELLQEQLELDISPDEPSVLIIHTHATEAYSTDDGKDYAGSEGYRTSDTDYNIVRVGTEIADILTESGIKVIHDTGIYDSPSYSGSYTRTLSVIEEYLEQYPSIVAVLDVHRDSGLDGEGNATKTTVVINGNSCSQVMLVVGTNEGGLNHPDFVENIKLSLRIQALMNRNYPGLARALNLRQERFNQHATKGSLIAEIGFAGNNLTEALNAARYFAEAYAEAVRP